MITLTGKNTLFRSTLTVAAVVFIFARFASVASADDNIIAKIRAGCIYHLAKLVTWPEDRFKEKNSPIVIGFIGDETELLYDYFDSKAESYLAQDRKLETRNLALPDDKSGAEGIAEFTKNLSGTHILYFGKVDEKALPKIIEMAKNAGVLTVGSTASFTSSGGMVGFTLEKGTMKIRVNIGAVEESNLAISPRFLQHAIIVDAKKQEAKESDKGK